MSAATLVWGAGAVGGTVAAALARAGRDILLVDRDEAHVAAIAARGLEITGPIAAFTVPVPAVAPGRLEGVFDRILLAVKAHHTAGALDALAPHLAPGGHVVSLQNGLNERLIARRLGRARTVGCFVNFGADLLAPGVVHHAGRGTIAVGELDGRATPRLAALHADLCLLDPAAFATDNIWGFLWGKLVYGALLFATALSGRSIADVLDDPGQRGTLADLAREVERVARAEGIRPEAFDGFDPAVFAAGAPAAAAEGCFAAMAAHNRKSEKTHSGIWRDLAVRRRPTEVDAQLGVVVEIAEAHGLAVPLTRRLVALIHEAERGRPQGEALLAALAAPGEPAR